MIPDEGLRVAVIGGGAGGMATASRIKRLKPEWVVDVFERTNYVSHAPCGIPFYLSGLVESIDDLCAYDVNYFRERRGVNVHVNSEVIEIRDGELDVYEKGERKTYEWDRLVFATGSRGKGLDIGCESLEGVVCLGNIDEAPAVKETAGRYDRIVVVGSGYIGVEIADALSREKKITVIEQGNHPLPSYDPEIAEVLMRFMSRKVNLRINEHVVEIEGKDRVEKVITDRGEYEADLVIVAVGVMPNVELAREFGIKTGKTGAIKVNEFLETSREGVYAVGDCAETRNIITGKPDWIPLAAPANKMGYVAGSNIAGNEMVFPGALRCQLTSFYDMEIGKAGLSEREALKAGFDAVSVTITSRSRASYIPGGGNITVKMVADSESRRVLGIQAIGAGVAKRIYASAALLYKEACVEDFFFTDFPFYPPKSPVWDPLVISARNMFRKLDIS